MFAKIKDCCAGIRSSVNKDELKHKFSSFIHSIGFDFYSYIETNESGTGLMLHACTYPNDWLREYLNKGYGSIDPVLEDALVQNSPYVWYSNEYIKKYKGDIIGDFFQNAKNHGINTGISIPLRRKKEIRLLTIVSKNENVKIDESVCVSVRIVVENYNMMFSLIEDRSLNNLSAILTNREKQALTLAALGATSLDSSKILGLSSKTVERQLQTGREKIWARSQASATAFATTMGITDLHIEDFSQFTGPFSFPIKSNIVGKTKKQQS